MDSSQWPPPEPPSFREEAFNVANALMNEANSAEIQMNVAAFEGLQGGDLLPLRYSAMEGLRLASIAMDLLVEARNLEDMASYSAAERLFRAVVALNESEKGTEDA